MFQVHTQVCVGEMSISPTFYEQLFYSKLFLTFFLCLYFFSKKESGTKATSKILAKLITGVNIINVEQAALNI
jgi:hypothetical protein